MAIIGLREGPPVKPGGYTPPGLRRPPPTPAVAPSAEYWQQQYDTERRNEALQVMGLVFASGREMWVEDNNILVYPRWGANDGVLRKRIVACRETLLGLLPRERQGPERL